MDTTRERNLYLTELANELRLIVSNDEAAELVTEIAGHLDSSGTDPREEFGPPTKLAAELVAHQNPGWLKRLSVATVAGLATFAVLVGIMLTARSTFTFEDLSSAIGLGLFCGALSIAVGPRYRDRLRDKPLSTMAMLVGSITVAFVATELALNQLPKTPIEVAAARPIGFVLIAAGIAVALATVRPVRFSSDSSLKTTLLGTVKSR